MPSRKSNDRYFWFGDPKFGHPKFRWFKPKLAKQTHIVFGQALWRCNLAGWACMCNIDSFSSHFQRFQTMLSFRWFRASVGFVLQTTSNFRRLRASEFERVCHVVWCSEPIMWSGDIGFAGLPAVPIGMSRMRSVFEITLWIVLHVTVSIKSFGLMRLIGTAIGKLVQWRFAARTLSIEFALDRRLISRLIRRCLSSIRVEWVLFSE